MESGNLSTSKIKAFTSTVTMHQSKHNNTVLELRVQPSVITFHCIYHLIILDI